MARFLVWSDLHNEFWDEIPEVPEECLDVDALLIAGDISTCGRHLDVAASLYGEIQKPVIILYGNHEFYKGSISEIKAEDQERLTALHEGGVDVRLLDGDVTQVAGVRIIGATLWTDMDLYPGYTSKLHQAVRLGLNDFNMITIDGRKHLDIETWLKMHWEDREVIMHHLNEGFDGPTIVMTHHMPFRTCIHPMREIGSMERNFINAGFASDMAWQMRDRSFDAWICGHSHDNRKTDFRCAKGHVPVISNARGYPKEGASFDPGFILEV